MCLSKILVLFLLYFKLACNYIVSTTHGGHHLWLPFPVCGAHCGGALRKRTLHSRRVLEPGVLLLLLDCHFCQYLTTCMPVTTLFLQLMEAWRARTISLYTHPHSINTEIVKFLFLKFWYHIWFQKYWN
jgi:hypothetical protein